MTVDPQEREHLHRVSVAGNTVAGAVGAGFGAAKLRDAYREEHPQAFDRHVAGAANRALKHGASSNTISRGVHLAQKARPGFKPLVVAGTAGSIAAGARRISEHDARVKAKRARQAVAKSAFGVELGTVEKFVPPTRSQRKDLHERLRQAKNPPPPKLQRVDSSALHSVGYQRQTRRMDVTFNGRPDKRYSYRMKPKKAQELLAADSKGRHYAKQVKGRYPDGRKTHLSDRARLLVSPVSKAALHLRAVGETHGALNRMVQSGGHTHEEFSTLLDRHRNNLARAFHAGHSPAEIKAAGGHALNQVQSWSNSNHQRQAVGHEAWVARGNPLVGRPARDGSPPGQGTNPLLRAPGRPLPSRGRVTKSAFGVQL